MTLHNYCDQHKKCPLYPPQTLAVLTFNRILLLVGNIHPLFFLKGKESCETYFIQHISCTFIYFCMNLFAYCEKGIVSMSQTYFFSSMVLGMYWQDIQKGCVSHNCNPRSPTHYKDTSCKSIGPIDDEAFIKNELCLISCCYLLNICGNNE